MRTITDVNDGRVKPGTTLSLSKIDAIVNSFPLCGQCPELMSSKEAALEGHRAFGPLTLLLPACGLLRLAGPRLVPRH